MFNEDPIVLGREILKKSLPLLRHKALLSKQVYMINRVVLSNNPGVNLPACFQYKVGWGRELKQLPLKSHPP